MTARLWITVLGVALNTMHQRRARVLAAENLAGELVRARTSSGSARPIALAILIAVAVGTGLALLLKSGALILG